MLEDLSENYLERLVLLKGHLLRRPQRDYGVDVTMFHFAENGEIENGEVRFQLKATDRLALVNRGTEVSIGIDSRDLHYWAMEVYPFLLVVFDAKAETAYWLDVKEYVRLHADSLDLDQRKVNVRIPVANVLAIESVDHFRILSLATVQNLSSHKELPDATRKPK